MVCARGIICGSRCGLGRIVGGCMLFIGVSACFYVLRGKIKARGITVGEWVGRRVKGELLC